MPVFYTMITAIDPDDGDLKEWSGPTIQAPCFDDAVEYCKENGMGYCEVIGELLEVYYELPKPIHN